MTPKEKAEELFYKYRPIIAGKQFVTGFVLMSEAKDLTKQCALIAVDEIIKQLTPIEKAPNNKSAFLCWEEVKNEIEKL
jgi:hypothetical protein